MTEARAVSPERTNPFAPFIHLKRSQVLRMWQEYMATASSDPVVFVSEQVPEKRFQYAAALNAMVVLVVRQVAVHDVRKVSFRRDGLERLILDVRYLNSHPAKVSSINLSRGDIPQIPFPQHE
jgi:hypothetical protein